MDFVWMWSFNVNCEVNVQCTWVYCITYKWYLHTCKTILKKIWKSEVNLLFYPPQQALLFISKPFWRNFMNDGGFDWPMSNIIMFWLIKFSNNIIIRKHVLVNFPWNFTTYWLKFLISAYLMTTYPISENSILQFYRENVGRT